MKKITIFLAAALCVFGLTACGSDAQYTEYQNDKIDLAKSQTENLYFPALKEVMIANMDEAELRPYIENNVETQIESFRSQLDENTYQYYIGLIPEIVDSEVNYYGGLASNPWDEMTMDEVAATSKSIFGTLNGSTDLSEYFVVDGYGFYNAITSFSTAGQTLGAPVETGEYDVKVDGDQIIITIPVVCTKGNATAEFIISNDMFGELKSASITQDFTMGEKMEKAALNTVIGISTVFIVLILICLLITCFGIIPKIQKSIADSKAAKEAEKSATEKSIDNAVNQIIANETVDESDDLELVAVIAAAIAAYEGSATTDGYVVRSIRRRR